MTREKAWELLRVVSQGWVEDEASDVVFAGEYEGRLAVRMAQQARDFTTVWYDVFLVGRVSLGELSPEVLDEILGTIYEAVELSFRSLVKAGFGKE